MSFSRYCRLLASVLIILLSLMPSISLAVEVDKYPILMKLVTQMSTHDGYHEDQLRLVLQQATIQKRTIDLINRQYEALPWHRYKSRRINKTHINQGVTFWNEHHAVLDRAYEQFGVPQSVIVALIGIETNYGAYIGKDRVLDSLVTLSAEYPRRSLFFTAELRAFLNMTRREKINPTSVLGSYAGAIGIPQFMPSSYQAYSVDFNDNAVIDLINEVDDAIGSVANYLKSHGWNSHQRIYTDVTQPLSKSAVKLVNNQAKLTHVHDQLTTAGVQFDAVRGSKKMMLIALQEEQGNRYVVGFKNFYVITRYNHSLNYAMLVSELAESIATMRNNR